MDIARHDKQHAQKKLQEEEKLKSYKYVNAQNFLQYFYMLFFKRSKAREMSKISGVCLDYEHCDENRLKGCELYLFLPVELLCIYFILQFSDVVSKIHTRIKPFEISIQNKSSSAVAEELWTLVEEVNSN
jgi:hypothetical protein